MIRAIANGIEVGYSLTKSQTQRSDKIATANFRL